MIVIDFDTWQPFVVAVIGLIAASVPLMQAYYANRNAKRAVLAATKAADTASALGGKIEELKSESASHNRKLDAIGVKVNGEREAALRRIKELEQELFEHKHRPPTGSDGG